MESHVKVTTSGRSRGFAILSFKTHEAAVSALSLNGTCLRGRVLEVRQEVDMSISRTRLPRKRHFGMRHRSNMEGVHSNVCFVNNLSLNSTDDDVCNMYTRWNKQYQNPIVVKTYTFFKCFPTVVSALLNHWLCSSVRKSFMQTHWKLIGGLIRCTIKRLGQGNLCNRGGRGASLYATP